MKRPWCVRLGSNMCPQLYYNKHWHSILCLCLIVRIVRQSNFLWFCHILFDGLRKEESIFCLVLPLATLIKCHFLPAVLIPIALHHHQCHHHHHFVTVIFAHRTLFREREKNQRRKWWFMLNKIQIILLLIKCELFYSWWRNGLIFSLELCSKKMITVMKVEQIAEICNPSSNPPPSNHVRVTKCEFDRTAVLLKMNQSLQEVKQKIFKPLSILNINNSAWKKAKKSPLASEASIDWIC